MTKKLEICFIFLLVLGVVTAQRSPGRPGNNTSRSRRKPTPPRGAFAEDYDTWCEDNNVENDRFFVHPWDCTWYIHCIDFGDGVITDFDNCLEYYFYQPNWDRTPDGIDCVEPGTYECLNEDIFWPPCPPAWEREPVFHPAQNCDSYYFCVGGFPVQLQCGPGLHWNANRGFCDDPRNAGCENNWDPSPPQLPDCPIGYTGNIPHPDDCNLFIACRNGNRSIQRCQHLHHFCIDKAQCLPITQNPQCMVDFSRPRG